MPPASEPYLGYLVVHAEADGFLGGLLILDANGDPVDFTYTDPVVLTWPTRVLFGARLAAYIATRILAAPLLASVTVKPAVLCFDDPAVLSRHFLLDVPAAVCCPAGLAAKAQHWREFGLNGGATDAERSWWGQLEAAERIRKVMVLAAESRSPAEMIEPFERLRLALREVPAHRRNV
jgi:hypothetical protein